jgi:hypothetical protein
VLAGARGHLGFRTEGTREPLLSISIEWDAEYFASRPPSGIGIGRLASIHVARQHVRALLVAIEDAWNDVRATPPLTVAVVRVLAALRAEGIELPLVCGRDLVHEPSSAVRRVSRALDIVLTRPGDVPMIIDVETLLGLSGRTIERRLPEVIALWGQVPTTFRELRVSHRLFQAALAMSHPAATTEGTARLCGFATPNALCRSFREAGLPSPGRIRQCLRELQ